MPSPLHIVVPVYNEGANFPALRAALTTAIHTPFEVFVVYDFDEDNTVPAVQAVINEGDARFHLIKNSVRRGVVGALLTGFKTMVNRGPILVVMGDLSDDLGKVEEMVGLYQQGFQLVAASRYMPGGELHGGPFLKMQSFQTSGTHPSLVQRFAYQRRYQRVKVYDAEMLNSLILESRGGFELSSKLP